MKTVLSVQSAVTMGAVGNTLASAVITAMGHLVRRIDTIQLIAHPGHGIRAGGTLADADFSDLLDGLIRLGFEERVDAVMTGYIGKAGQIDTLAKNLLALHELRPELEVMVDPAIGDHGHLYVDEAIADGVEKHLVPLAHVITPNAYEFERLTGVEGRDHSALYEAGQYLLEKNPRLKGIAITGWGDALVSDYWIDRQQIISHDAPSRGTRGIAGGGDLFAAILMSVRLSDSDWPTAFEKAARLSRKIIDTASKSSELDIDLSHILRVLKQN